jgi:hypothetical protein
MQKMMYLLVSQHVFGHHHAHHQENGTKPTKPMGYSTGRAAVDSWRRGGSVCTFWDWFHEVTSPCPSSGEWYKTDKAYGVQHWPWISTSGWIKKLQHNQCCTP